MKVLIVYSHPRRNSFNGAILDVVIESLKKKNISYELRDLYGIGFNPVLSDEDLKGLHAKNLPKDILTEQEFVKLSDKLIFIYPIWWGGMPSMMKGYIDRIFLNGFAYKYNSSGGVDGLLKGKDAYIFNTHGTDNEYYDSIGMTASIRQVSDMAIFKFCGIDVKEHLFLGNIFGIGDEGRKRYLESVSNVVNTNF